MHRSMIWIFLVLVSVTPVAGQSPLTIDDELDRVVPSQTAIAPDGKSVVFVLSELNWEKNKRDTRLMRVSTEVGAARTEPVPFTRGPGDGSPLYSPDGRHIAFLRKSTEGDDKGKSQLWVIPAHGGEAKALTELSEGVMRFVWAPDSGGVVFTAKDPIPDEERKRRKDGDDAIYVFEGPNGQGRGRWSNVWTVRLDEDAPTQVTHEAMDVTDIDVSPDGELVAFVFRRENGRNSGNLAEIAMARLDGGAMTRVTENEAPESRVRFSPDGRTLAYLAPDLETWELRQNKLVYMDIETRNAEAVLPGFDGVIRDFRFTSDGVRFVAGVRSSTALYALPEGSREPVPVLDAPGFAADVSFAPDGAHAAFVWSDATTPPEVAVFNADKEPVRLTELNPEIGTRALGTVRTVRYPSRDGLEIEALLFLPAGYRSGERVPLILEIHGGPAGVFTQSWRGDRHVYTGLGYAIVAPNVRGSTAYGDDHLRGNMRDIGGGDYHDVMAAVDHVIEAGIADEEQLGVRGWSYGGILGGWVVTHTDRFKAASLGAMVSDWRSEYGQGFNFDVKLWYIGGDPWTNSDGYIERSPLTHAQNVTTPTLLLHGEADTTDTIEQSMNFFNALWEKGVPSRFIRFPREGHGIREPRHQRVRFSEEIAWMQKYVRGVEWTNPERGEEADVEPTPTAAELR